MKINNKRLVDALRSELELTEALASGDMIMEMTKGTFMRQRIELGLAWQDFKAAVIIAYSFCIPEFKKMVKCFYNSIKFN